MERRWMVRAATALCAMTAAVAALSGCAGSSTATQSDEPVVRVATVAGLGPSQALLEDFTARSGIRVQVRTVGSDLRLAADVGAGRVRADLVMGIPAPNTSVIGESRRLLPYTSTAAGSGSVDFPYVRSNRLTAYSYDFVCAAFDPDRAPRGLAAPVGLDDLTAPAYRGRLTFPDPRRSSAGLAFVLTANDQSAPRGGSGWTAYWSRLAGNDARLSEHSDPAGAAAATTAVRVISPSRAGVPAAQVIGSTCTRRVFYTGIVAGSPHVNQSKKLTDFLLARAAQSTLPESGAYPVTSGVSVPADMRRLRLLWSRNGENNTDVAADDAETPGMLKAWARAFGGD